MKSFVLLERPEDKRRNRLVILGFIVFTAIISYVIYGSVQYGMSKIVGAQFVDETGSNINQSTSSGGVILKSTKVTCGNNQFKTYIANNDSDRERGLSVFNKLKDNEAMIFVFDTPSKYEFWMKNMKFSIDIVWLDQNKHIIDIIKDISADTYPEMFAPSKEALYVLELKAGIAEKNKIKIGDSCDFDFSALK